jgi:ATP/maltotriose-dependent transcriptional regulator MalT
MADNDLILLEDARDAVFALEKAYRKAVINDDLDAMMEIEEPLAEAENNLSQARLKLLQAGQLTSNADVAEMRRICGEMDQAADTQQLIEGAAKLVAMVARFI